MLVAAKRILLLMLLVLAGMPVSAQFTLQDEIVLNPFINETFDLQGLRPAGWTENQPGSSIYLRFRDPTDRTAIMMQSMEADAQTLVERLQETFQLEAVPPVSATLEANDLTWNLYEFTHQQGTLTLFGALAVTEDDARSYFVLMQTSQVFYGNLHQDLFLPVVRSISPIVRYEDASGLFEVPVLPTWTIEAADSYVLLTNADETIRLLIAAVESDDAMAAMTTLWQQYDADLVLDYVEDALRVVDDPGMLRGLDRVTLIEWEWQTESAETVLLRQGVAREFKGVQYIILMEGTFDAIEAERAALSLVDGGLLIVPLAEAIRAAEDGVSS